jgi:hypothetical protein
LIDEISQIGGRSETCPEEEDRVPSVIVAVSEEPHSVDMFSRLILLVALEYCLSYKEFTDALMNEAVTTGADEQPCALS